MGRTQLQDAVPMTLGQEFDAFAATLGRTSSGSGTRRLFREVNLGATAIGTGINTDPRYAALAVEELGRISGQPIVLATDLVEATWDTGAFVLFSGVAQAHRDQALEDLQRPSAPLLGPAGGFRRNRPAGGAGRLLDHARARSTPSSPRS